MSKDAQKLLEACCWYIFGIGFLMWYDPRVGAGIGSLINAFLAAANYEKGKS